MKAKNLSPLQPALHHHRRSIRLKGHDYAGGGVYFVTLCAHREAIAAYGGAPFGVRQGDRDRARQGATHGARQASPERGLIEERWRITAEKCPQMSLGEWVIMPDHFHALIRMQAGPLRLGDVIGGFKAAVSREWNRAQERATQASPEGNGTRATQASPGGNGTRATQASPEGNGTRATQVSPLYGVGARPASPPLPLPPGYGIGIIMR